MVSETIARISFIEDDDDESVSNKKNREEEGMKVHHRLHGN